MEEASKAATSGCLSGAIGIHSTDAQNQNAETKMASNSAANDRDLCNVAPKNEKKGSTSTKSTTAIYAFTLFLIYCFTANIS